MEPGISTMVKYPVPWPLPGKARSKQGAVTGKDISGSDYYKSSYDPVRDIALVDRLPTQLLAKFEDCRCRTRQKSARQKRPLDLMHGQISRLGLCVTLHPVTHRRYQLKRSRYLVTGISDSL